MVGTCLPCSTGDGKVVGATPLCQAIEVCLQRQVHGLFGPCHLQTGRHHGSIEGGSNTGMAGAMVGSRTLSIPGTSWVLQAFHPGLWRDHHAADTSPTEGRIPVVTGGSGGLSCSAASSDGCPGVAVASIR
jgi:hypothetical protein